MMQAIFRLSIALFLIIGSSGFVLKVVHRKGLSLNAKPGSYAAMLEAAKLSKAQPQHKPIKTSTPNPQENSHLQPKQPSANGLPFDDEMYSHLKYVIEKLSARMKSEKALSSAELKNFRLSVEAIIADSRISFEAIGSENTPIETIFTDLKASASEKTPVVPYTDEELEMMMDESDGIAGYGDIGHTDDSPTVDGDAFGRFRGIKSTWNIPGMDKMTTEEYYKAINDRNHKIKETRKNSPTYQREPVKSYFDSLSKKAAEKKGSNGYWDYSLNKKMPDGKV